MKMVSYGDKVGDVVRKLACGEAGALTVLEEIVARCQEIDPACDSPFAPLLQLDDYKIAGAYLWAFYALVCDCDLVKLMAVLCYARMGRIKPLQLRAAISHKLGRVPPPWWRPLDPTHVLGLVRAHYPNFGAPPQ